MVTECNAIPKPTEDAFYRKVRIAAWQDLFLEEAKQKRSLNGTRKS